MRTLYSYFHLPLLIFIAISAVAYFDFTAEDAYITYRYAENLVDTGALIYNQGEPINAMTSPLHAVFSAVLFFTTGNTVLSNKVMALILLMLSTLLIWYRYRQHIHYQVLALILSLPSCVLLWTFGGLETPILLFLASISVILADRHPPFRLNLLGAIFFLAGLAFLTRYDSVLFFLPMTLHAASKARSIRHIMIALAGALILPLVWFFFSFYYYGDLLPTSFYVKTPQGNLGGLIFNGVYIASYLLFVGIIPAAALVFVLLKPANRATKILHEHFKRYWWLYIGLLLEILYGLTMATHHMMFSFRFFVPYIPSTVILVIDLLRHATEVRELDLSRGRPAYLFTAFLLSLILFQFYQHMYTYKHSVNGISLVGEYRSVGIRDYVNFVQVLEQEALDIEDHWLLIHGDSYRDPRIITYAAGMLPYTYEEAYIYEKLVSYRHCHERFQQGLHADYLHILAPRLGKIDQQLPRAAESYDLVSSYEMSFDGSVQTFLVYYNPKPEAHNLSVRVYDPCNQAEQAAK